MAILLFFISIWYLSLFCQTFFQHRYAAHGAFKMSKGWERFFFILSYITQGSSYMSPRAYAIMHRYHHAFTDTEKDPHSPSFSSNIFSMMWRTRTFYQNVIHDRMEIEARFTKNLPVWPAFDRFANGAVSRIAWVIVYILIFVYFATSPWLYLLLPIIVAMGAFHGAVINWFAHKYGYINFKLKNTSMNLFSIDVLMLGESYHNNHHKRPSSINFGHRWHEIDPIHPIILLFAWLGIIKLPKLAPVSDNSREEPITEF
jgi:stearoyl-CoA desaturase (Delta-9 desaturase)